MSTNGSSGDAFSNNLFTGLGPLLALVAETVTKQYLSIAAGWEDWIMLQDYYINIRQLSASQILLIPRNILDNIADILLAPL